ncbi:TetR/AcrR family transcriptional regulator [Bacillus spongiae]|uniref:TetR/AcrR family transcriptional regulator n=1 Tax=Bacillus spongiae TaxID=2683610 RepID=A0ABU8HK97_9BACI
MTEKELLIIETAMKLFANKGFSNTSIQEIAKESGISKGAFYLHFKSKDSLFLGILQYHTKQIKQKVLSIEVQPLPPREKFIKQFQVQIEEIEQHKAFIIMQLREKAVPFSEEIQTYLMNMRYEQHVFYQQLITSIYGEKVEKYLVDLSFMLRGIFETYMEYMIFEKESLHPEQVAVYLLSRLDDLVAGIIQSNEEPLFRTESICTFTSTPTTREDILLYLETLQQQFTTEEAVEVQDTVQVLIEELNREAPRAVVLKGMLTYLPDIKWKKIHMLIQQYLKSYSK